VHRDLKPANLFLAARADGSRRIKVLDFGVSKSLLGSDSASQLSLTQTASFVGSPLYMSPEQLDSAKSVDARSDIWSLGVVLFELLAGRAPFLADSIPRLLSSVMNDSPPSFASLSVKLPPGLEAVVKRALAKSRDERYASVGELAQALAPFGPDHAALSASRVARLLAAAPGGARAPERDASAADAEKAPPAESSAATSTPMSWPRGSGPEHVRMRPRKRWAMTALLFVLVTAGFLAYRFAAAPDVPEPTARPAPPAAPPLATPAKPAAATAAQVPEPAAVPAHTLEPSQPPPDLPVGRSGPASSPPSSADTARTRLEREPGSRRQRAQGAAEPSRPAAPGSTSGIPDFGGRR
jgi:serine/threonine-protein kinase